MEKCKLVLVILYEETNIDKTEWKISGSRDKGTCIGKGF